MKYLKNPNVLKFHELMNTEDMPLLTKVATFCKSTVSFLIELTNNASRPNGL